MAAVTPGIDLFRHADMVMAEDQWLGLLYGDFTGLAPLVSGTSWPSRDAANKVAPLGILMYTFAYIPAGANPDPDPRQDVALRRLAQRAQRYPTDGFQLTSVQAILDIVNRQAKQVWDTTPRARLPQIGWRSASPG